MVRLARSRHVIAVQDLARSAAFYRNVLGFTVHEMGDPGWRWLERDACVILAGECPDALPPRTLGDHSYFAYVEVMDADALFAEVAGRGAELITPPRDEPWGMREFGIRTVDGHRMRFGSRLADASPKTSAGASTALGVGERAVPVLPVDDLGAAKRFYVETLGFEVAFESTDDGRTGLLGVRRGTLDLTLDCPMSGHGRNACVSLRVHSADAYYEQWRQRTAVRRPPRNEPWGGRTFDLLDPFGNTIFVIGPAHHVST